MENFTFNLLPKLRLRFKQLRDISSTTSGFELTTLGSERRRLRLVGDDGAVMTSAVRLLLVVAFSCCVYSQALPSNTILLRTLKLVKLKTKSGFDVTIDIQYTRIYAPLTKHQGYADTSTYDLAIQSLQSVSDIKA